jgi:ABC-2 type transport system ATP-binding protein
LTTRRLPRIALLNQRLTGRENLVFFAKLQGCAATTIQRRVDEVLEFTGLTARANDPVAHYSGGMQRRLNLAAAIVHEPEVLLLDEPTAGVDPQSRARLFETVLELRNRGGAILYTTHAMEEAERLCDRVGILDQGRLQAIGSVAELVAKYGDPPVVEVPRPSLEQVFLNLTGKSLRDG